MLDPGTPLPLRLMAVEGARAAVNALADVRQQDRSISIDEVADAAVARLWDGLRKL
jgi:hypothetical protein